MSVEEQKPPEISTKKSLLESLETWSKVLAAIAIPVVIAIGGWIIQDTISRQGTNKDYVNLALQILEKKPDTDEDYKLRSWAVDLINASSPVRFDLETTRLLKAGTINLTALNAALSIARGGYGFAVSPDSKLIAVAGRERPVRLFDLASGKELLTISGHEGTINALAFSPDSKYLLSGSADKSARLFEIPTQHEVLRIERDTAVIGVGFSDGGSRLVVRDQSSVTVYDRRGQALITFNQPE